VFSGSGICGGHGISEGTFIYSPPGSVIPEIVVGEEIILYASRFESR